MKNRFTYLLGLLALTLTAYCETPGEDVTLKHYGITAQQFSTGTGHGPAISFGVNILCGRKELEAGLIYNDREGKLSGLNVKYKIHLGKLEAIQNLSRNVDPYVTYNLIYQKSTSYALDVIEIGEQSFENPDSKPGVIATFGHYMGMGVQYKICKHIYADVAFGFGVYQGSLDKSNTPDTFGFHKENHGFTYSYNIGIGYRFK
ncbi:MAG: hypothetical protein JXJ22_06290 [Bacteroidales bacterium]|nr:hypothetical protein [Bacteroidales bacterium]